MTTTTQLPAVVPSLPQTSPADEHNQELVKQVRPPDWSNPRGDGRYNMVVLGGGTAGLVTAAGAAGLGARVALIERNLLGGDCLNVGCVPSKALIRCAKAIAHARDLEQFGVHVSGEVALDFANVMRRMRELRARISHHDSAARFRDLGVDVFIGQARFVAGDAVEVDGQRLQFARACIATGTRPVAPPIDGLNEADYLTNETLFSLTELPRRLAIVGGGPIGCEMAQTFARFGATVYLIEMADHVLQREDQDAAGIVETALRRDGIELLLGTGLSRVRLSGNTKRLHLQSAAGTRELEVDALLVSVGRAPNTEDLDLETAGIKYTRQGVSVNDWLQTTNPRVYAAGDVCLPFKFTHSADASARIVIQNALFFGRKKVSRLTVPWCTYTDPEVAHVGMYEHEAREQGIDVETIQIELSDVDRAVLDGDEEGFLRIHVRKGKDSILGATLVARQAGELISEITATMACGGGLSQLAQTIHCYPTQAEVIKKAADAHARGRLTPRVQKIFSRFLAWRR